MKKIAILVLLIMVSTGTAFGQYYYKKGHNQDFKFSGFGLNIGYYYTFQRFYNIVYLPYFGSERFNGNIIYGAHLDFHIKNGWYLRGSGNVFFDKLTTKTAIINDLGRSETIEVRMGTASLSLLYEVQYKKRFYPYFGFGVAQNYYQIIKTVRTTGRGSDSNVDSGYKLQLLHTAGINYTINGNLDLGLEGRFSYGRPMHTTPYRPFKLENSYIPLGIHGPMLLATLTFRFDSRYFRRKIGKYSENPGTSIKR